MQDKEFVLLVPIFALIAVQVLDEPSGQTAEVPDDGSVQMIDVN